jgi:CRP-like cAMP-binding protein
LLERGSYHDTAVAVEAATLRYIPAEEIHDLLRNTEVSQQFTRLLARRAGAGSS